MKKIGGGLLLASLILVSLIAPSSAVGAVDTPAPTVILFEYSGNTPPSIVRTGDVPRVNDHYTINPDGGSLADYVGPNGSKSGFEYLLTNCDGVTTRFGYDGRNLTSNPSAFPMLQLPSSMSGKPCTATITKRENHGLYVSASATLPLAATVFPLTFVALPKTAFTTGYVGSPFTVKAVDCSNYHWITISTHATGCSYTPTRADKQSTTSTLDGLNVYYFNPSTGEAANQNFLIEFPMTAGNVVVSGSLTTGSSLTCVPEVGTWLPGDATISWSWFVSGALVVNNQPLGVTSSMVKNASSISCVMSASKSGSSTVTKSTSVPIVLNAPIPTISGSPSVGQTLAVDAGPWSPIGTNLTYQWMKNGAALQGSTGSQFSITSAEAGSIITVSVNGVSEKYGSVVKLSAGVAVARTSNPTPSATPISTPSPSATTSVAPTPVPSRSSTPTPSPLNSQTSTPTPPKLPIETPNPTTAPDPSPTPSRTPTSSVLNSISAEPTKVTSTIVKSLTAAQISAIPVTIFRQLPAAAIAALSTAQAKVLSNAQLTSIPPASIQKVNAGVIASLSNAQLRALTDNQVARLTSTQLKALTAAQRKALGR